MAGKRGEGGKLPPEDFKLWKAFTRDIEPLEEPKWNLEEDAPPSVSSKPEKAPIKVDREVLPRPKVASATQPPQLDGRTEARLKRGKMPIDGRLDLHGYNQEQAHEVLNNFILSAHARGKRCLLVITGKGGNKSAYGERTEGILRQKLPVWLGMAPLRGVILKILPAAPKDGGSGAWYIYLRRQRPD